MKKLFRILILIYTIPAIIIYVAITIIKIIYDSKMNNERFDGGILTQRMIEHNRKMFDSSIENKALFVFLLFSVSTAIYYLITYIHKH